LRWCVLFGIVIGVVARVFYCLSAGAVVDFALRGENSRISVFIAPHRSLAGSTRHRVHAAYELGRDTALLSTSRGAICQEKGCASAHQTNSSTVNLMSRSLRSNRNIGSNTAHPFSLTSLLQLQTSQSLTQLTHINPPSS